MDATTKTISDGGERMTQDYTITWNYIVTQMSTKYGIEVNSRGRYAFGELETMIKQIWHDYFQMLYEHDEELQALKNGARMGGGEE